MHHSEGDELEDEEDDDDEDDEEDEEEDEMDEEEAEEESSLKKIEQQRGQGKVRDDLPAGSLASGQPFMFRLLA